MIKYEVGQVVEIRNHTCGHYFKLGENVRVKSLHEDGTVSAAEDLGGHNHWYLDEDDIKPLQGVLQ